MPFYYGVSTGETSPASQVVVDHYPAETDLGVSNVRLSLGSIVDLIQAEVDLFVGNLPLTANPFAEQQVGLFISSTDLLVADPALVTNPTVGQAVSLHQSAIDLLVAAPPLTTAPAVGQTVPFYAAEISLAVKAPEIITNPPVGDAVGFFTSEIDLLVSNPTLVASGTTSQAVVLYTSEIDLAVKAPPITTNLPDAATAGLYVAEVDLLVSNPPLTAQAPAANVVAFQSAEIDLLVADPVLITNSTAAQTVGLYAAEVDLRVSNPPLSTSGPGAVVVGHQQAAIDLLVANPALNAQATDSTTVSWYTVQVDLLVADVNLFVEDIAPPPNTAACASGDGHMYTDPLFTYLDTVDNGYINVWFKFTGSEDPGEHKMIVFSVSNAVEEVFQFGVGRHGNTTVPDLFFERSDNTRLSYAERWTWLEEEESAGRTVPNIYDGDWHMLTWGNEKLGVDGTPFGWYFWIDGQQYGITHWFVPLGATGEQDEWFAETSFNLDTLYERLDATSSTLITPSHPLTGCIDELMVVNDRTIGFRSGIGGEVTEDMEYLYNDGFGRLIEQVEADNPNGLWLDVYNAWKFEVSNVGREYVNPSGTNTHDFTQTFNISSSEGIVGGGVISVAIDCGADLIIQRPTPFLYTPYVEDGPMSHPNNQASFVVWFKPGSASPTPNDGSLYPVVLSKWGLAGSEYELRREPNGDWTWLTASSLGARFATINSLRVMDPNQWYMIGTTFSLTTAWIYIWWFDGSPNFLAGNASIGTVRRNTGSLFRVGTGGRFDGGTNQPAQGWIDDILYFNHVLPNTGATGSMEWLFNGGAGRSFENIQSNDLTLYNQVGSHWNLNETNGGTQQRLDDADGTDSALVQYGTPVTLLTSGIIGTGPGHILD